MPYNGKTIIRFIASYYQKLGFHTYSTCSDKTCVKNSRNNYSAKII